MIDGISLFVPRAALGGLKRDNLRSVNGENKDYRLWEQELGFSNLRFKIRESDLGLRIRGSVPYGINNNNFETVEIETMGGYFDSLSGLLNVDLMGDAEVKYFEYGAIVETDFRYKEFAHHHVGVANMNLTYDNKRCRIFSDNKFRSVKMYDAGYRLRTTVDKDLRVVMEEQHIYEKKNNYIKFEIKYKKAIEYFGLTSSLRLAQLLDGEFIEGVKNDLLETYETMNKTGFKVDLMNSKLGTTELLFITLKTLEQRYGNVDVNNLLLETLNVYDKHYSPDGKCIRKKNINKLIDNIGNKNKSGVVNEFDIYNLLLAKLGANSATLDE